MWNPIFTTVAFHIIVFFVCVLYHNHYEFLETALQKFLNLYLVPRSLEDYRNLVITGCITLNAAGCLVFRFFRRRLVWLHVFIHTLALYYLRKSRLNDREYDYPRDYIHNCFHADTGVLIYIMTYISALHLVCLRYGKTEERQKLLISVHAATGAIAYICSGLTSLVYLDNRKTFWGRNDKKCANGTHYLLMGYFLTIFLLIEPNFNWRHMATMFKKPIEPKEEGEARNIR